jgi:hypothetical protein
MSRNDYTPEERRAWGARQDAMRAQAKLNASIDANRKASRPTPAPKEYNSKRSRTLVIDTSGSTAFADIRWKAGQVYYEFSNGYSYSDPMEKATFRDWQDADSLGAWWNKNWR